MTSTFMKAASQAKALLVNIRYGGVSIAPGGGFAKVTLRKSRESELRIGKGFSARTRCILNLSAYGKLVIGDEVFMNDGVCVNVRESVEIGDGCLFGQNVMIYDHDHNYKSSDMRGSFISAPVSIGERTWVGSDVVILKGVSIGCDCVIAAGCIVSRDVPDGMLLRNAVSQTMKSIERHA